MSEPSSSVLHDFNEAYQERFSEHAIRLPFAKVDVCIRALKSIEQKAILKAAESDEPFLLNKTLDEILRAIVTDWGTVGEPKFLYLKDRMHLLLVARSKSKGSKLTFNPSCPICETEGKVVLDLDEIEIKDLPDELIERKAPLLNGRYVLTLRPPTRADEIEKDKYTRNRPEYKSAKIADQGFLGVAMMIAEISEGDSVETLSYSDRVDLLGNLAGDDKDKIDAYVREVAEYGFPLSVSFECPDENCGLKREVPIDLTDFFFR